MKTLETIPETYSQELINDFKMYFDTILEEELKDTNILNFNFSLKKWYEIYEELKQIFQKYYIVNNDNYDLETPEEVRYAGGCCILNSKYKDKYIKDVNEIVIKSAYPQKINKLLLDGMESNDGYFPYVFNLVYQHIGKQDNISPINLFINFTYGVLTISKEKYDEKYPYLPRVDKDIKKDVSIFYSDIMSSIDDNLYYYIDTDTVYLHKDSVDEVFKIFDDNNIEYVVESPSNYLFLDRKRYLKVDGRNVKIKGLKLS